MAAATNKRPLPVQNSATDRNVQSKRHYLPFVRPRQVHELGVVYANARRSDAVGACHEAAEDLSVWDSYAPDESSMLQLFGEPDGVPIADWTGNDAPEGRSFGQYLELARFTCSKAGVAQRAIAQAATAAKPDQAVVDATTEAFTVDPIGTVNARADQFAHSRVSQKLFDNAVAEGAPPEILDRLAATVPPTQPVTPESAASPDPSKAGVRPAMVEVAPALLALVYVGYSRGENILLNWIGFLEAVRAAQEDANCHEVNLYGKPDDKLGRLVYDLTYLRNGTPHNGTPEEEEWFKAQLIAKYGEMNLPFFTTFIENYWYACERFPGDIIHVSKTDIRRAYHLQRWTAEGSLRLAVRITDDLVMVPITWGFGSREAPYAYHPISLYFDWLHLKRMQAVGIPRPLAATFVDDTVTMGSKAFLDVEVAAHEVAIQRDLHENAVNVSKRSIATRDDVLGVRLDTITARAGLSNKAYLKLLYVFFVCLPVTITTTTVVPLHTVQCVASLAHCYGKLFPLVRHTASVFYNALRGRSMGPTATRRLTSRQIDSIELWREYLFAAHAHASIVSSPLTDVYYNDPVIGGNVYKAGGLEVYSDASEIALGGYVPELGWFEIKVADLLANAGLPCDTKIPIAYLEMIAYIVVYAFAVAMQPSTQHVHVHVDNQNALQWAAGHISTTSDIANTCVLANALLQVSYGVLQTRSYIRSEENKIADAISRLRYRGYATVPEYRLGPQLERFCVDLLNMHDSSAWLKRVNTLMPPGCDVSSFFSRV